MAVSAELFKDVFRRWPSGVAVVTSRHEGSPHGMVVGSFCSLSSEPPLVMVSAGVTSRTREIIERSGVFAVSILSEAQTAIFERFAGLDRAFDHDRFAGLATVEAPSGMPVFAEGLAWVDCRVVARHPGEGYTIFVGEVVEAALGEAAESAPLVYFRRRPRALAATEAEADLGDRAVAGR
jgi:flavin reductase (DIM6/NTAB) family NADH-FMN oxidoreductase RutF